MERAGASCRLRRRRGIPARPGSVRRLGGRGGRHQSARRWSLRHHRPGTGPLHRHHRRTRRGALRAHCLRRGRWRGQSDRRRCTDERDPHLRRERRPPPNHRGPGRGTGRVPGAHRCLASRRWRHRRSGQPVPPHHPLRPGGRPAGNRDLPGPRRPAQDPLRPPGGTGRLPQPGGIPESPFAGGRLQPGRCPRIDFGPSGKQNRVSGPARSGWRPDRHRRNSSRSSHPDFRPGQRRQHLDRGHGGTLLARPSRHRLPGRAHGRDHGPVP